CSSDLAMKFSWIWLPIVMICACRGPAASVDPKMPPGQPSEAVTPPAPNTTALADMDSPVPIELDDPVWGSRTALLTLVLFGDYQCPFTARLQPTIEQLQQKYGSANLRIVWKNYPLPFHEHAR